MGDREVPFDSEAMCGVCGKKGAFDFMGDYLCPECVEKYIEKEAEEVDDED